jgi:hypothetical protein
MNAGDGGLALLNELRKRQPHHGRGGSAHVGRVRIKLAKIVSDCLGVDCQPEDLRPTLGWCRSSNSIMNDTYRWEVFCKKNGVTFVAGSYDTMTNCVKAGAVSIDRDYEISAVSKT